MKYNVKGKILKETFLIGLFISSLLVGPWSQYIYELPRIWFIKLWILLLLALGFLFGLTKLKKRHHDGVLITGVLLFFVAVFSASLVGVDFLKSLIGNPFRDDGLITLLHIVGLFFFLVLFWEKDWEKGLINTLAFSSVANAVVAILLSVFLKQSVSTGTFGQNSFLAGYILVTTPFVLLAYEQSKGKFYELLWFCAFVINVFAVLLTQSLGGIIGMLVLFLGVALNLAKASRRQIFLTLLFAGIMLGMVFFWIKSNGPFTFESRDRIVARGILAFLERPVAGWGWANFDQAFQAINWPILYQHDIYIDKAHSVLMDILVTTGIIGAAMYLLIVVRAIKRLINENAFPVYFLLALVLFLFHTQTNVVSVSEELIFWVILGIVANSDPVL